MPTHSDDLAAALADHNIQLPSGQIGLLDRYCKALWEWNTKLNLTRHTDYEKFVSRDVVDSLALAEFLRIGENVLDVGTGGGVPGIILAIVRPDLQVFLAESVTKKARAVADIVEQLELPVTVFDSRAEDLLASGNFDTIVARAVAKLAKLLRWFQPHWEAIDRILLVKGPAWVEERADARHQALMKTLALRKLKSYPLPGTNSESVILQICPKERLELFE